MTIKNTIVISSFGNARPIISMNIIDSCQLHIILKDFTVQRSYSAISSFTSSACILSLPLTNHNGTMGKRSLEEGEEQQQQQKPSNMLVSFSKRQDGLFKKVSELCVKCGAQIDVVILSPAGIPHAF
ncbi:hypothetical protein G4B88_021017 [Cannabis sativa]|uniref:MADS-box domain-containing protein n=1 Tax=Cannabis sativa TaxID=3483 RepID=A0A7J6GAD2_CANSA|nr:hypothetical protein G4B88_021017 [Cannabis sativa]